MRLSYETILIFLCIKIFVEFRTLQSCEWHFTNAISGILDLEITILIATSKFFLLYQLI